MKIPIYRNQSTDLLSKSMDWFLYKKDLRHERVKESNFILFLIKHNLENIVKHKFRSRRLTVISM